MGAIKTHRSLLIPLFKGHLPYINYPYFVTVHVNGAEMLEEKVLKNHSLLSRANGSTTAQTGN